MYAVVRTPAHVNGKLSLAQPRQETLWPEKAIRTVTVSRA